MKETSSYFHKNKKQKNQRKVDSPPVIKLSPQQGGERVRVIFQNVLWLNEHLQILHILAPFNTTEWVHVQCIG